MLIRSLALAALLATTATPALADTLVEHVDGRMEILHWAEEIALRGHAEAAMRELALVA